MKGLLFLNLGTPDAPTTRAVRRYLGQFLSDPRVIDVHPIGRWLLLNFIILPFRSSRSAEQYQKIWRPDGSPHLVFTEALRVAVAKALKGETVEIGMRYGQPSIASAVEKLMSRGVTDLTLLPLFPQYASASWGSAVEEALRVIKSEWNLPAIRVLPPFFDHPGYISGFAEIGRPVLERVKPDHTLFSFHGLPERQIRKSDKGNHCLGSEHCCREGDNGFCYRAQCFRTADLIAQELRLGPERYSVSFQSRLGRTPWIKPYTDLHIVELARQGIKKVVVFSPAFVTDCLETLEEIGIRLQKLARKNGIETLELVPSLNDHPSWVETVIKMVRGGDGRVWK